MIEDLVMAQTDIRSLQQIKRETEQTRASLTDTVDQLKTTVSETASDIRHRISPDAIKAEVSDYIKSRGEQLWADLTVAARNNPMQAVAVGASVAYPLLRLARAIPLPVLMVGAGLFFADRRRDKLHLRKLPTWPPMFRMKWSAALVSSAIRLKNRLLLRQHMHPISLTA